VGRCATCGLTFPVTRARSPDFAWRCA